MGHWTPTGVEPKDYDDDECNVKLRKVLNAHKSHVRETSLFTGAIPNPVRNSQTSRFVSVPGENPARSSRGDSVVLRLQSVMMVDVRCCRSRTVIGYQMQSPGEGGGNTEEEEYEAKQE